MFRVIAFTCFIACSFNAFGARWQVSMGLLNGSFDYTEAGGYSNPSFYFLDPFGGSHIALGLDTIYAGTPGYVSMGDSSTSPGNLDLYFSKPLSDAGGVLFLEPGSNYYGPNSFSYPGQNPGQTLQNSYVVAPEFPTPDPNPGRLVYNESGQVAGVNKLLVNGVYYDVTFQDGSYTDVKDGSDPAFLGDKAGAQDAATEIKRVLESNGFQFSEGSIAGCDSGRCSILSPYLYDEEMFSDQAGYLARKTDVNDSSSSISVLQNHRGGTESDLYWGVLAVYQVTEVPLPAVAWLFLSALGGLGFLKRRNRSPIHY